MREIVTIQVGDFANYIGSHFWNIQDELLGLAEDEHGDQVYKNSSLDMGVLYRAGETHQGVHSYNPRLISVGFQGSLGCFTSTTTSPDEYSPSDYSDILTWTGNVDKSIAEPHKKNLFLQRLDEEEHQIETLSENNDVSERSLQDKVIVENLENSVQFWTDFSKVKYHSRSICELHGSWADPKKFDNYGIGKDILQEGFQREDITERLRFFVEECDHLQGIQFTVDDSGGFSGVASDLLEYIADEYINTPVLLYSTRDPRSYVGTLSHKEYVSRALHDAISFSRLSCFTKLMVPVGLPSLSSSKLSSTLIVKDQKAFHSSAIYAACIHSISLPFRMEALGPTANSKFISGAVEIGELIHMLAGKTRQNMVSVLDVAMPAPSLTGEGALLRNLHPLTPETKDDMEDYYAVESLIVHGAFYSGYHRASISQVKESICAQYESEIIRPTTAHLSTALCPLPLPLPFPAFFASHVGKHGELLGTPTGDGPLKGSLEIDSIPMAARLRSSKAILPFIEKRLGSLRRFGIERGAPGAQLLRSWGFGKDEIEDMGEGLAKMLNVLDPHSETDSDSD